ncbi:MAG: hypothetical protein K1X86_09345 [Ignavibacteria bacterium]|nr:hypothetical protein [Ignavibacteria bacterium]
MNKKLSKDTHKKIAIDCFNAVWDIMEKNTPSDDDICEAIRLAHVSIWHWKFAGTELNQQRGEWICSRAHAHFGFGKEALFYAKRCYNLTMKLELKDFDLGYGYECMARAYMALGKENQMKKYLLLAKEAAKDIQKKSDRDWFMKDLKSIK